MSDRFWSKVALPGPNPRLSRRDQCWEWQAAITRSTGYGTYRTDPGGTQGAHRIAYELVRGPIPDGLHIDHLCRKAA